MNLTLRIASGPLSGREFHIDEDEAADVGSGGQADIVVADPYLSHLHFSVECLDSACMLHDLNSNNGTRVNGVSVEAHALADGDEIEAGQTAFVARVTSHAALRPPVAVRYHDLEQADAFEILSAASGKLYAILDAARDPQVLELMERRMVPENRRSLYEGDEGVHLAAYAPYLAELTGDEALLAELIAEGWGESWGVFLSGEVDLDELRHHLRRFLMVEDEAGKKMYFRYYDPRVLRPFLPTCSRVQAEEFFGPVRAFWCESHDGGMLLEYRLAARGTTESPRRIRLSEAER